MKTVLNSLVSKSFSMEKALQNLRFSEKISLKVIIVMGSQNDKRIQ